MCIRNRNNNDQDDHDDDNHDNHNCNNRTKTTRKRKRIFVAQNLLLFCNQTYLCIHDTLRTATHYLHIAVNAGVIVFDNHFRDGEIADYRDVGSAFTLHFLGPLTTCAIDWFDRNFGSRSFIIFCYSLMVAIPVPTIAFCYINIWQTVHKNLEHNSTTSSHP